MQLNKPFRARIYGADFEPAQERDKDYVLLHIAVPKNTRIPPGVVEITLLDTGFGNGDMLDTEISETEQKE